MRREKLTWEDVGKISLGVCPKCNEEQLNKGPYTDVGPLRCLNCGWLSYIPISRREIVEEAPQ